MAESNNHSNNYNRRAVIVGIPGVGKTTVITRAAELLSKEMRHKTSVVTYGTLMFEEAQKLGVKNRDEMRRLPVEQQGRLQEMAARRIAEMRDGIVIVDTHLFISTREGYYPGLPMKLATLMNPTNLIMVTARPEEIAERRRNDPTRKRDEAEPEVIKEQLEISKMMLASCSIITGAPFAIVSNDTGGVNGAAAGIASILLSGQKKEGEEAPAKQ